MIFRPRRDEATRGWRKQHNEELHNFYSSLSITRLIKPRSISCVVQVERMREKRIIGIGVKARRIKTSMKVKK
jgi:hypothetical protein